MNRQTSRRIREHAFDVYRDESEKYSSHTDAYRKQKRDYTNGLSSQNPKTKLSRRQRRLLQEAKDMGLAHRPATFGGKMLRRYLSQTANGRIK